MKAGHVVQLKHEAFAFLYINDVIVDVFDMGQPDMYLSTWLETEYGYRLGHEVESDRAIMWDIHKLSP